MADGYWNQQQLPPSNPSLGGMLKRPRPDYELPASMMPSGHAMQNYLAHEGNHTGPRLVKDTKTIGSAYDRYLQSTAQRPTLTTGEASNYGGVAAATSVGGGLPSRPRADPVAPDPARNGRAMGFGGPLLMDPMPRPVRETVPLPPDASNTLYVEGLPSDCRMREVAHIFRPFVGYKEVRLVSKESKHRGGDPLILCFVDFISPACAATALSALQGYKMDESDSDSSYLRMQFSKHPGPRSGAFTPRRKR